MLCICLRDYSLQRVDAAQRLTRRPRRPRATSTQTSAWPRQNSCACAGSRAQTTVARLSVSPQIAVGGVDSSIPAVRTAERLASMGKLGVAHTHTDRTKQREVAACCIACCTLRGASGATAWLCTDDRESVKRQRYSGYSQGYSAYGADRATRSTNGTIVSDALRG